MVKLLNKRGNAETDLFIAFIVFVMLIFIGLYVGNSYLGEKTNVYYSNFSDALNNINLNQSQNLIVESLNNNDYKSLILINNETGVNDTNIKVCFNDFYFKPFKDLNLSDDVNHYDLEFKIDYIKLKNVSIDEEQSTNKTAASLSGALLFNNKDYNISGKDINYRQLLSGDVLNFLEYGIDTRGFMITNKDGFITGWFKSLTFNLEVYKNYNYAILRTIAIMGDGSKQTNIKLIRFDNINDIKNFIFAFNGLDMEGARGTLPIETCLNSYSEFRIDYVKLKVYE